MLHVCLAPSLHACSYHANSDAMQGPCQRGDADANENANENDSHFGWPCKCRAKAMPTPGGWGAPLMYALHLKNFSNIFGQCLTLIFKSYYLTVVFLYSYIAIVI